MSKFTRRKFLGTSAALPLGLGATAAVCAQDEDLAGAADLVVTGANIITMEKGKPTAEAIAVRGSRILAIGSNEEVLRHANAGTTRVDAAGLTMTPSSSQ